ncbi:hypothetical protein HAPAU_05650 [Halalkalicoccus paucihalophilus]|uniref:Uncharacterized protein n=1 Tax=Halalkalicoccus paucihalophilus TaxID=1008153 RepID=A0A151AK45_9EURY|nr:hypothetical protein [Halalkalicoccus paucihalophilus]KYH27890.1 hypothetical protein HAPAU_05650 [Halalkalicoccus paucihalophilus]
MSGTSEPIEIEPSERFLEAAGEWGERRMLDDEAAVHAKAEQALLEIEHLVSGATEVEFDVEDGTVRYDPSEDLAAFLDEQAALAGIDRETVLELYVNLFSRVFLEE